VKSSDGWQRLVPTTEIPLGTARNFNLQGREIAIFHTKDGFLARSGTCRHQGFKFELCDIRGDEVRCPLHDWRYRISTGEGISPRWPRLARYPLRVEEGFIWVNLTGVEEPEPSDPELDRFQW